MSQTLLLVVLVVIVLLVAKPKLSIYRPNPVAIFLFVFGLLKDGTILLWYWFSTKIQMFLAKVNHTRFKVVAPFAQFNKSGISRKTFDLR